MSQEKLDLEYCSREEYAQLAKYCGTIPESKVILMSDGTQIGSRTNQYFLISPIAFRVAFGKNPSGKRSKNYSQSDRIL